MYFSFNESVHLIGCCVLLDSGEDSPVVVLADLPHGHQSLQVLVGLERVDVVQRAAVPRIAVRGREVDGYLETRRPIRDQPG